MAAFGIISINQTGDNSLKLLSHSNKELYDILEMESISINKYDYTVKITDIDNIGD